MKFIARMGYHTEPRIQVTMTMLDVEPQAEVPVQVELDYVV